MPLKTWIPPMASPRTTPAGASTSGGGAAAVPGDRHSAAMRPSTGSRDAIALCLRFCDRRSRSLLGALEEPAVDRLAENVSLHRLDHSGARLKRVGTWLDVEFCIERVELEH